MKDEHFNLEESPFIDMRKDQTYARNATVNVADSMKYTLPTYDDNVEWRIIKPRSKFDESKIDIPDKADRETIDEIIQKYKQTYGKGYKIAEKKDLIELIQKHQKMIKKRSEQGYVKASYVGYISCNCPGLQKYFQGQTFHSRLCEGIKKFEYPLGCVEIGMRLCRIDPFNTIKQVENLFKKGVQFGEPFAFSVYGSFLRQLFRPKEAYELLKNAQINGYPIAYPMLGQLFLHGDNETFQKNLYCAKKYFDLSKKFQIPHLQQAFGQQLKQLEYELAQNAKIANSIISTEQHQSKVIANFITNKFVQRQMLANRDPYRMNFGMTNNFNSSGYHGICFKPKTFYVVFSPQMVFPSRGFLGQDEKGIIEIVNIYNWHVIDPQKLKLLHRLGTRVVLNEYIRKYGANDHLPCYRIQNPYSVEIYPGTQRHFIPDEKYRNFAKVLFGKQLYKQAMAIYDHLIQKKATNLQIVYSNKGLIYQNQNNIPEAIANYKKSLQIKKYQKSQLRLAYIYLNQQKFKQAKLIANQIQDQKQRKSILKIIQEKQNQKIEASKPISEKNFDKINVNSISFFKKQVKIQKLISQNPAPQQINPNAATPLIGDIVKYIVHYKSEYSDLLKIDKNLSSQKYMKQVQKIYDAAQLPIKQQNLPKFTKFFDLSYRQFKQYSEGNFFQQSLGYMWFYTKKCFEKSLIQVNLGIQFAASLGTRCNYLENRLQDYCIQLERMGKYDDILKILNSCNNHCTLFCRKISQMLFNQSKHQENIQYCKQNIQKLQNVADSKKVFETKIFLMNQKIKSMIKLKKFKQGSAEGQKFIDRVKTQNPNFLNVKIVMKQKEDYFQDLFKRSGKCLSQYACDLPIWSLKNNIALCFYFSSMYQEAISFIDQKYMQKYFQTEKQMYFSTLLLKIRILLKSNQDTNYVVKLIQSTVKQVQNIQDKNSRTYFKSAFIKFLLDHELSKLNIKRSLIYCQEILKIGNQYGGYVVKKLTQFCIKNQQQSILLLDELKKTNAFQIIYQNTFSQYKGYCYAQIKSNQKISQALIQYLGLQQYIVKQQEQIKEQNKQQYFQLEDYRYHYQKQILTEEEQEQPLEQEQTEIFRNLFEGYTNVGRFHVDNVDHIIYFSDNMRLEKDEESQFMISAQKFCKSQKGHNGIKIMGNQARLKIRSAARLLGEVQQKDGRKYVLFYKRQGHDDYKRKK